MLSFILSSLVAASAVSAQSRTASAASASSSSNPACTATSFNINSQSDLTTLTACTNVRGNVVISQNIPVVNLGGITTIDGDLTIINNGTGQGSALAAITSLSGPTLQSISGTFTLTQLTQLNSMSFPSLTQVGGISFTTLPVLQSLGFGGVTRAMSIQIIDTQLSSLSGINLQRADTIVISNNGDLSNIALNGLASVDTSLLISANAAAASVSLPVLTNCGNFTVQQIGNLSINALANVTGSMGIQQTTLGLIQANNLTRITADLFITNNTQLMNISMPMLETVSGFVVASNSMLKDINYPALATVQAVDLSGSFATVELPALTRVNGGVNIQTTASPFTCPIAQSLVRSTSFVCRGAVASPTSNTTRTTGTSGSTTSSGSSTSTARSAAGITAANVFVATLFVVMASLL